MKTKQERRATFVQAVNTGLERDSSQPQRHRVLELFDAEWEDAVSATAGERDRVNVALTVLDAGCWEGLPQLLREEAAAVLLAFLKDGEET